MNIMTALFDQDEVTRSLVASKARVARQEERQNTQLEAIKNVMAKFHVCLDEALDALNIPEKDRAFIVKQIELSDKKS